MSKIIGVFGRGEKDIVIVSHEPFSLKAGILRGLRASAYVIVPVLGCCLLNFLEVIGPTTFQSLVLILSVVLYLLAFPVSAVLGLDSIVDSVVSSYSHEIALCIMLPFVMLNFCLFTVYREWRRSRAHAAPPSA